jgi:hypothetical protein
LFWLEEANRSIDRPYDLISYHSSGLFVASLKHALRDDGTQLVFLSRVGLMRTNVGSSSFSGYARWSLYIVFFFSFYFLLLCCDILGAKEID